MTIIQVGHRYECSDPNAVLTVDAIDGETVTVTFHSPPAFAGQTGVGDLADLQSYYQEVVDKQ